jgi:hypothetical protein
MNIITNTATPKEYDSFMIKVCKILITNIDGKMKSRTEIINMLDDIDRREMQGLPDIYPPTTSKYVRNYYFNYSRIRFAFKRLVLFWFQRRYNDSILNEDDLIGNDILSNHKKNRRILKLWDWNSHKYYLLSINDILGTFRSKLINDISPKHPSNPYTNIEYSLGQRIRILRFVLENADRLNIGDQTTIIYLRYGSISMVHQMIRCIEDYPATSIADIVRPETETEKVIMSNILPSENIVEDKKELYSYLYDSIYTIATSHHIDDLTFIPKNKIQYYVYSLYYSKGLEYMLNQAKKWVELNSKRPRIIIKNKNKRFENTINLYVSMSNGMKPPTE